MIIGTAQIDITPRPGVELCGFAARTQPSIGVLDPLYVRALYLEHHGERLLWLHADVLGFERETVLEIRRWAQSTLDLRGDHVIVSATHTHSGPATLRLREAGQYDPDYVSLCSKRLRIAAQAAMGNRVESRLVMAEGRCDLAVDRRMRASAHTDPRVLSLGWVRADGTFAAVLLNYAMHPVALGASNRHISGDVPGAAARFLSHQLPGNPIVLVTNGACGNLNPPAENVSFAQIEEWGMQLAESVADRLQRAVPEPEPVLRVAAHTLKLPLEVLDRQGIGERVAAALQNPVPLADWGDRYRRAVAVWQSELIEQLDTDTLSRHHTVELFGMRLGPCALVGVNAEVFSEFTDWVRRATNRNAYTIGYANGDLGYLPTHAAYAEGGYEVDVACFFYGGLRPKPGGLERVTEEASHLVAHLFTEP